MPRELFTIEQTLALLAESPRRIAALTSGLSAKQLQTPPGRGEWSANEVLAHLRSCADVWGGGIATILAQDKPTLRAISPRTWIRQTDYPEQEFQQSLRAYARQRTRLLKLLKPLTPEDWSRTATITGAGKPLERTVLFYARWLAEHERPHIKQISRIVSMMRS